MISDARGGHVSPGIYTEEKDVTYSVKSLGITSLGLVGETIYGPAFENIEIKDWGEWVDYFGGTSPEKFKGTGLPKYEAAYIAKNYLKDSKRLNVVRVLGLSGYHAGPAFVIKSDDKPVAILRSKMVYNANSGDICAENTDNANPVVKSIEIGKYHPAIYNSVCALQSGSSISLSSNKKFSIIVKTNKSGGYNEQYEYNVSLNPQDSDYIYKVISSRPDTGSTPVYIEAIYENALTDESVITSGAVTSITNDTVYAEKSYKLSAITSGDVWNAIYEVCPEIPISVGDDEKEERNDIVYSADTYTMSASSNTFKKYVYGQCAISNVPVYDDFTECYRPSITPWFVSEAYATTENDVTKVTMKKLFRFVTISDGENSNYQVKVSIQNIKPEEGTFDVIVRDFNDNDTAPVILEKFTKCSMVEGDSSYIAYKIGSIDGGFISKSKYIAVEMADSEELNNSIPAGFLGYPMPKYGCANGPKIVYNTKYKPTIKAKKQYFGLTKSTLDTDILKYKGKYFYNDDKSLMTNGFHMDSVLSHASSNNIFVDGENGFSFDTVSVEKVTSDSYEPRLINSNYMNGTIYKDVNLRKFTAYFYGGFDGWDVNRESRTNTDKYKSTNYSSNGSSIFTSVETSDINNNIDLPSTAITSDYYAYLAACRVFRNPQDIDINILATAGIDWHNNGLLTEEIIGIVEDTDDGRGGDTLYIMAAPGNVEMSEIPSLFNEHEYNSSYACTYYPWILYFDSSSNKYLQLPVTKDVVRNMAATDNNSFPWFAPAGLSRGNVDCVKAVYKTTLSDEDELYENCVNPVKSFAQDGVKIWGNKTAYNVESPLNRINVRRLMIRVKKLIVDASRGLLFSQYDETLEKQFRNAVEPILENVKSNRGIHDYRLIIENTAETRDQHILPAKIMVKPTQALEWISISFVVYPESVSFDE